MDHMKRKLLSLALALCVLCTMFVGIMVPASAATQSGAKAWMDSWKGKQVTNYGGQCVALFDQYLIDVFGKKIDPYLLGVYGCAYDLYEKDYPGWSKIPANQINGDYRVGDIVIWGAGDGVKVGTTGHVALVYSVNGKDVKLLEQNWKSVKTAQVNDLHTDYLKGIIRPVFTAPVIDPSKPVQVPEGVYSLEPKHAPGMRLDVNGGSKDSGANIQLYEDNGSKAQQFKITASGGYYKLVCENSGMAVDLTDGVGTSGTNVQQYKVDGTKAQDWRFFDAGDGYYYIVPRQNDSLALDVASGAKANKTNIRVYDQNATDAQKWKLIPVDADCTVTYDPNGGTGAPEAQTVPVGEAFSLSRAVPVREGYAFLGWALSAGAAEAAYQPGDSVTPDSVSLKLFALWQPYAYRIGSLVIRDGEGEPLDSIPEGSFQVTVPITRQVTDSDALVFLAAYTAEGRYRGLMYVSLEDMSENGTVKVTLPVENPTGDIASLKAFAVSSFKDLTPMGPASAFPVT